MSLPALADFGLDPALRARFSAAAGVPKAVRQRAEFFVFFAETPYPLLAHYRPALAPLYRACPKGPLFRKGSITRGRAEGRPAGSPAAWRLAMQESFTREVPLPCSVFWWRRPPRLASVYQSV